MTTPFTYFLNTLQTVNDLCHLSTEMTLDLNRKFYDFVNTKKKPPPFVETTFLIYSFKAS